MEKIILEDIGNKEGFHKLKHFYWESNGVLYQRVPLPVGDYVLANDKVLDAICRKQKRGIDVKKMDFLGTYTKSVDSKKDIQEIVGNICGKQHERFRDECILAQNNGIKLIVLIENDDGIKEVSDLFQWQNPRTHRYNKIAYMHKIGKWQNIPLPKAKPTSGETLAKSLLTMQLKYGVEFRFCKPEESGSEILKILTESEE